MRNIRPSLIQNSVPFGFDENFQPPEDLEDIDYGMPPEETAKPQESSKKDEGNARPGDDDALPDDLDPDR